MLQLKDNFLVPNKKICQYTHTHELIYIYTIIYSKKVRFEKVFRYYIIDKKTKLYHHTKTNATRPLTIFFLFIVKFILFQRKMMFKRSFVILHLMMVFMFRSRINNLISTYTYQFCQSIFLTIERF